MILRLIALVLIAQLMGLAGAFTLAPGAAADTELQGRVPVPVIGQGKGDACVADTDFMRRHHMDMLLHQRDETMQQGIRTERYSLKECVACHVVPGVDGLPVKAESPTHFCSSCHLYAAVKIDCFECHASRPEQAAVGGGGVASEKPTAMPSLAGMKWK